MKLLIQKSSRTDFRDSDEEMVGPSKRRIVSQESNIEQVEEVPSDQDLAQIKEMITDLHDMQPWQTVMTNTSDPKVPVVNCAIEEYKRKYLV